MSGEDILSEILDDIQKNLLKIPSSSVEIKTPNMFCKIMKPKKPMNITGGLCHLDGEPCIHQQHYMGCDAKYNDERCKRYDIVKLLESVR